MAGQERGQRSGQAPGGRTPLIEQAGQARARGDMVQARRLLQQALRLDPTDAAALNMLGLVEVAAGNLDAAAGCFSQAVAVHPQAVALWLNLADAHRRRGSPEDQLAALDGALTVDPYAVPAMAQKAELLDDLNRVDEAVGSYQALAKMVPDTSTAAPLLRAALQRGAKAIQLRNDARQAAVKPAINGVRAAHEEADWRRADVYLAARYGGRRIYHPEPTGALFPFLPADEFFDRALFPWFEELERGTASIRAELEQVLADRASCFAPYVQFPPGVPVNQWAELQQSSRWDAYFLYKDGVPIPSALARCPATAAIIERLPLLDIAGRGPTVMFSLLNPKTTIPPHSGTTNIRATVHLALIVGGSCRFRVGGETREWREGHAWAFDDTIEHEAWNDSDAVRVILIVDAWNPHLTAAERAMVRAVGG